MTPVVSPSSIVPADSFGPTTSVLWVFVVGWAVLLPFLFAAWRFIVYRGRALRADSMAKEPPQLEPGPALLAGRVESDDGGPALRLEIDQKGREWAAKSGASHEWREEHRTVHARPFRLHLANGEAVLVEPGENVQLVGKLETEKHDGIYRRRVAELASGERVWVSGVLAEPPAKAARGGAYRSGPGALVVRGTGLEPLEVASGSLDVQFAYWRQFYQRATLAFAALCLLVHGVLFGHFYALFWAGKVETARLVDFGSYVNSHKGGGTTHYVVAGVLDAAANRREGKPSHAKRSTAGDRVADEVDETVYEATKERILKEAPFIVVPWMPSIHAIGRHPDLSIVSAAVSAVAALLGLVLGLLLRRNAMPWYEQGKIVERGRGTLSESAWRAQVPGEPGLFTDWRPRRRTQK